MTKSTKNNSNNNVPPNILKRREQNRRAQQLHRAKRATYLHDLEEKCASSNDTTSRLVSELEAYKQLAFALRDENARLTQIVNRLLPQHQQQQQQQNGQSPLPSSPLSPDTAVSDGTMASCNSVNEHQKPVGNHVHLSSGIPSSAAQPPHSRNPTSHSASGETTVSARPPLSLDIPSLQIPTSFDASIDGQNVAAAAAADSNLNRNINNNNNNNNVLPSPALTKTPASMQSAQSPSQSHNNNQAHGESLQRPSSVASSSSLSSASSTLVDINSHPALLDHPSYSIKQEDDVYHQQMQPLQQQLQQQQQQQQQQNLSQSQRQNSHPLEQHMQYLCFGGNNNQFTSGIKQQPQNVELGNEPNARDFADELDLFPSFDQNEDFFAASRQQQQQQQQQQPVPLVQNYLPPGIVGVPIAGTNNSYDMNQPSSFCPPSPRFLDLNDEL